MEGIKQVNTEKFIVKVHASIYSEYEKQQMLVYNKNRSIIVEGNIKRKVSEILNGRSKAYFWVWIDAMDRLMFEEEASIQEW